MADALVEFEVADSSGPPAGIYRATFEGVVKTSHPEYGDGARFDWRISEGEHRGRVASRTCKPQPSAKNVTGRIMAGLLGRAIAPGEKVTLAPLVGKTFTVVDGTAPNGTATRVESCIPA